LPVVEELLEIKADDASLLYQKGSILYELNLSKEAIQCFDKILELDPQNISALADKGKSLKSMKIYDEAVKYFARILQMDPHHDYAWYMLKDIKEGRYTNEAKTVTTKSPIIVNDVNSSINQFTEISAALAQDIQARMHTKQQQQEGEDKAIARAESLPEESCQPVGNRFKKMWKVDAEPHYVAVDSSGNVYVTVHKRITTTHGRLRKKTDYSYVSYIYIFDQDGNLIRTLGGTDGFGHGQFKYPDGIAIDSKGNVYVADSNNNRIQVFDSNGKFITKWGTPGSSDGQFGRPYGIAIDSKGNVYVADSSNYCIQVFAPK
jgi:tetratricopeptide (TPR) repeat protein